MFKRNKAKNKIAEEKQERINKAIRVAWSYGQIDGAHHKMWVIDQMVRELCESDEEYRKWVELYEAPVGYEDYYKWDVGIAP